MDDIHNIIAETRCFCRPVGTHWQCQNILCFWEQVDDSDFVALRRSGTWIARENFISELAVGCSFQIDAVQYNGGLRRLSTYRVRS